MNTTDIHFSLVVLCYRSEEAVIPFVERLHAMLAYFRFDYELVLVGNYFEGSEDRTPAIVKQLAARLPHTRAVVAPKRGMMGWDMRTGLDAARGQFIGIIDGDGQFPLESILSCLMKIETEDLDLVKTYRVNRGDGIYRRCISAVYNLVFRLLFKTSYFDINSKPKIIRRSKYALLQLESDDWFTDAEIMIQAARRGFKVGEIPVHFYANENRRSFVKPRAILEFISNLIRYRFFRKPPVTALQEHARPKSGAR